MLYVRRSSIRYGGIRPPARVRRRLHLTAAEREEIFRGIAAGLWAGDRDGARAGVIVGVAGDQRQWGAGRLPGGGRRPRRVRPGQMPKLCRSESDPLLGQVVLVLLEQDWSPQQIAASLQIDFAGREPKSRRPTQGRGRVRPPAEYR